MGNPILLVGWYQRQPNSVRETVRTRFSLVMKWFAGKQHHRHILFSGPWIRSRHTSFRCSIPAILQGFQHTCMVRFPRAGILVFHCNPKPVRPFFIAPKNGTPDRQSHESQQPQFSPGKTPGIRGSFPDPCQTVRQSLHTKELEDPRHHAPGRVCSNTGNAVIHSGW